MEELLENIRSFWRSAELVYSTKDFTSASILYFKCLFVLLDLVILKSKRMTPKDHTERFRILEVSFPSLYSSLDRIFSIYRDTYSLVIGKDKCDEVRKNVVEIARQQEVSLGSE